VTYTTRYTNFARVRGFEPGSPEAPMMFEFIAWIRSKWAEWAKLRGRDAYHLTSEDHADFDAWLAGEGT
jgi:hypothetical protein